MSRLLLLLRRQGYEVYFEHQPASVFIFRPEVVTNLEVLSKKTLQTDFEKFLQEQKIPISQVMILIADEALFFKQFPLESAANAGTAPTPEVQQFLDMIPVSGEALIKDSVTMGQQVIHYGLNRQLYLPIKKALDALHYEVQVVCPAFVSGVALNQTVFGQQLSLADDQREVLWGQLKKVQQSDLLCQETPPPEQVLVTKQGFVLGEKKQLILVIVFILIAVAILGGALWTSFKPLLVKKPALMPVPSLEPVSVAPTTQQPEQVPSVEADRTGMRFQIINASGVTGQASSIKDMLTPAGYVADQFELGNGAGIKNLPKVSEVAFANTVPEAIKSEVFSLLKKNFSAQISSRSAELIDFDIVITTVK